MFRVTTNILHARSLLCRRHPIDLQLAAISFSPHNWKYKDPTERETCKIPPPPPPLPPKDTSLFWGAMAIVFMAGGFAVYAKTQPEVRDWLTLNAPWFDDLIAVMYQENMTYSEMAKQLAENFRDYALKPKDGKPRQCSLDGAPVPIGPEPASVEQNDEDEEEKSPCEKLPAPVATKGICEIEKCLREAGDTAIINYITARDACAYYNKLVQESMVNFNTAGFRELHAAMQERLDIVKDTVGNAVKATTELEELTRYLDCGVKAPKEAMENTKAMLNEYQDKIKAMNLLYLWENDKALAMDSQWQKVEDGIGKYTDETQTMFPGLKYESSKPHVAGDVDLLLYHTLRYVEKLKAELAEAVSGVTERVNRGLEMLPQGEKERRMRDAEIMVSYRRRKCDLDKEFRKRSDDQQQQNLNTLRNSLKKQLEKSQDTLVIRLQQKEQEASEKLNKMVSEKVASEKKLMKKQLYEMSMKLKLVEDKLNARLKAERETRRSQELWTAGASLLAATKKGDPYVDVNRELKAIEKASGDGDKLVLTVLKAIPDSVRAQGLVPESVLREKYHLMEKTALKVALVEQDGAPLPIYFLSWLQSVLLFMKISGIPQEEIDKPPKVPSKDLDTFDLLQRARFWIERGNIAHALRYVSSLEGASRGAAGAWSEAARSHLETRQAAEAVLAHAAALGLQYI